MEANGNGLPLSFNDRVTLKVFFFFFLRMLLILVNLQCFLSPYTFYHEKTFA